MGKWLDITEMAKNERTKRGGRKKNSIADSLTLSVFHSTGHLVICFRVGSEIMKRSRMMIGDMVRIRFDPSDGIANISRTLVGGYQLCPSGGNKGDNKLLSGQYANALVRIPFVGALNLRKEKMAAVECESVEVGEEGILFKIPESMCIRSSWVDRVFVSADVMQKKDM